MKKIEQFLMLLTFLIAQAVFVSCNNDKVTISNDGKASNGAMFAAIDDQTFYLDYIEYKVEEGHLVVSGYDKTGFNGVAKIVSSITYKGSFYEVLEIGKNAFEGCDKRTSVSIPKSVAKINHGAFQDCSSLTSVEIGNSVTSIGSDAFISCSSLTSIEIPNSVTSIGSSAFSGCSSLTSIEIPNSVTSIEAYAFQRCSSLASVICRAEDVPELGSRFFYDVPQSEATLYVPASALEAYKEADQWKDFGTILPIDGTATGIANVTISEAEYTAYVTEFDVDFTQTEGLAAYKVTSASAAYATLEEIDFAPMGTAVILNGEAGTYTLYEAESEVDEMEDNIFMAGGHQVGDGATIYALGNKANGVGFYLVAEGVAVPADKGYLVINSTSEAKAFIPIGSDEATGIDTIAKESTETKVIYNLAGQRITEPTQSGIYIMNGKKVFINK